VKKAIEVKWNLTFGIAESLQLAGGFFLYSIEV
jgi:hypothetical protein